MDYWRIYISRKNAYDIYIKEKEFEKLNSFLLIGESVIDRWDPSVELYFKRGGIDDSDVFLFNEDFFIIDKDSKVRKIFDLYAGGGLEYLNFKCDVGNLIIAYPVINIDCIDMDKSKYKVYKGDKERIQRFEKLYLNKEKIGQNNLFRMKHLEGGFMFCSDILKNELEKEKVRGLEFTLID